jgi:hypothetical protein
MGRPGTILFGLVPALGSQSARRNLWECDEWLATGVRGIRLIFGNGGKTVTLVRMMAEN